MRIAQIATVSSPVRRDGSGSVEALVWLLSRELTRLSYLRQEDWFTCQNVDRTAGLIRPLLQEDQPQLIYLPHPEEWHPDDRAAWPIIQAAVRLTAIQPPCLRAYEVWTPLCRFDHVEDISRVMRRKLRAIRCYASQTEPFRYDRAVRGLNQYRGILAGRCRFAEVFQGLDGPSQTGNWQ